MEMNFINVDACNSLHEVGDIKKLIKAGNVAVEWSELFRLHNEMLEGQPRRF
jgi:hypothetical protein